MSSINLIHLRPGEHIKAKDLQLNSLFKDNFIHFQETQMKTKEEFHPHRNTPLCGDWGEYFALNYQLKGKKYHS